MWENLENSITKMGWGMRNRRRVRGVGREMGQRGGGRKRATAKHKQRQHGRTRFSVFCWPP